MPIRPSEHRMRYTEEKETKNTPRSQAVTARIRWERSAYAGCVAMLTTAVRSCGRSRWPGAWGPGVPLARLLRCFQRRSHLTTRLRLIIHMAQLRVWDIPVVLACSLLP